MITAIDTYRRTLHALWHKHADSGIPGFEVAPYLGQDWGLPANGMAVRVLTMGLNPSFVESLLLKHWEQAPGIDSAVRAQGLAASLMWQPSCSTQRWAQLSAAITALDHHSRSVYGLYYKPLEGLVREAGYEDGWVHLDALPLRETDQKALEPYLPVGPRPQRLPAALEEILHATMTLVTALRPEAVVVANSRLAQVLEHELELTLQPNGHRYDWRGLPGVPFMLGSQLSGGATSKYARQRLVCDLRDVRLKGAGFRAG